MVDKRKKEENHNINNLMRTYLGELSTNSPKSKWTLIATLEGMILKKSDFRQLAEIALSAGLTKREYAQFLHINPRTLDRNLNENYTLDIDKSEKVLRISKLVKRGVDTFGNIEKFSKWIREYNTGLQKTPIELFTTIAGIDLIENVLIRIEYGVYS